MALEFRLPDLGEGLSEAELVRWLVKPGDTVTIDQAIAQVQTDKALVEMPAPAAGIVTSLGVQEGQIVPVGTLLVTIDDHGQAVTPPSPHVATSSADDRAQHPGGGHVVPGPDGGSRWGAASGGPERAPLATPAVRRLARELSVDLEMVHGSGPSGRIVAEDVRSVAALGPNGQAAAGEESSGLAPASTIERAPAIAAALVDRELGAADEGPAEERLPLRGLRRRIAENMLLSVSTIPQVTSLLEVDATALVAMRRSLLPVAEGSGIKLSYLPFIVKALVLALRKYPYVNATIDDSTKEIVLKKRYHIGIATATPDGLLVPVLRDADCLTVLQIASELTRLADAARERKLPLDELRGSTFTISNFGAAGGYFATPIINPGESGILGLGRISDRPWAVDGRVEVRPILPLSFTADHRLIDGELALQFMNSLVATLENPNLLLLELR